jgi:mannose-1-phosphate guanylyltransferase/mannose-6-phosphate isomerase
VFGALDRYPRQVSYLRPVILSGGSGTRLWPLSTPELPKQFVRLFDGESLFDLTLARLRGTEGVGAPIVVTGAAHVDLVEQALDRGGIDSGELIVEPTGRNTAPAAIAAALAADHDDVLVILPSDHLISDVAAFRRAVAAAADHARQGGIVTFGIHPSRPETGYGYIEIGAPVGGGAFEVRHFKEKPDLDRARKMIADGRHVWNSGMFIARADYLLQEAQKLCPAIAEGVVEALPEYDGETIRLTDSFSDIEADSIDYAIMEKTERALVIPIDLGWDDVGSYRSLLKIVPRDAKGNHVTGEVTAEDVSGSFLMATSRKVAVAGLSDVVVVETPDAVLVVPLDRSQDVKELSRSVDRD